MNRIKSELSVQWRLEPFWDYDSYCYPWVYINAVIDIRPKSDTLHFSTIPHTAEGKIPIAVSPYVNGSACLVGVNERII